MPQRFVFPRSCRVPVKKGPPNAIGRPSSRSGARQRAIARKGGETVSQNREHMAAIGAKGGERVSQNREHMAAIGRKGGESSGLNRANASKNKEDRRENR